MQTDVRQHRYDRLVQEAKANGTRVAIISMYDVENNAVRVLAATLRQAGHHVTEIYFKDWISNHLDAPSAPELASLVDILRKDGIQLACFSIRASAYYESARVLTRTIHRELEIPVLWGGMHPTLMGDQSIEDADLLLQGEGEPSFLELANRLAAGQEFRDTANVWARDRDGNVVKNGLAPLVHDLDVLAFRDYTTHDHKYFIWKRGYTQGDPQHGDPVFQMMGSRGCIYKCAFCYNSTYKKEVYPNQKWFRTRSVESTLQEIKAAQEHWGFHRIRFDDEVFNVKQDFLDEFCRRFPKEIGLPFEIFIEPKLVNDERMEMLRDAGLTDIYMGVQATERVTGHLYDRRVKNSTVENIGHLMKRIGVKPHFQLIWDDPASTDEDMRAVFDMVQGFPHPYDLYMFSMTVFPGSELNRKLLEAGTISEYDIEGQNVRTFYQHRVNMKYPRPPNETFWIAMCVLASNPLIPRSLLQTLSRNETLKRHPLPVVQAASASNYVKMAGLAARMIGRGEMTGTLVRRWMSAERVITA